MLGKVTRTMKQIANISQGQSPIKIKNVLLLRKITDIETTYYAGEMANLMRQHNVNVYVEDHDLAELVEYDVLPFSKEVADKVELMVTIGGDGTILHGASKFQQNIPPILTFGKGTLGFMCIYGLQNYKERLLQVLMGEYTLEKKTRLQGLVYSSLPEVKHHNTYQYNALNEFFITRTSHVLSLDIYINDIFVTQSRGGFLYVQIIPLKLDGLIISTPTGSTAYCLSAGGPIVHNDVPCTIICPICPLSLSFRPIVLPEDMNIRIRMSGDTNDPAMIIGDGFTKTHLKASDTFLIQKSKESVEFVHPLGKTHFDNWALKLKRLLSWNTKFSNE